ncbi:unnamed protein product, partial [marine sediment metagenome]
IPTGFKCALVILYSITSVISSGFILLDKHTNMSGTDQLAYCHATNGFNVFKNDQNATGGTYTYWAMEE